MRVVEHMRRFETSGYVIRLWLDAAQVTAQDADVLCEVAREFVAAGEFLSTQETADQLAHTVRGLNAVEVLYRNTGDGTLVYPDWP
jgi:hypothetical protein